MRVFRIGGGGLHRQYLMAFFARKILALSAVAVTAKFLYGGIHCKEISYVLPEKELRGLSHNFTIQVSVSYLYSIFPVWPTCFPAAK
jgi:hypothetical protein